MKYSKTQKKRQTKKAEEIENRIYEALRDSEELVSKFEINRRTGISRPTIDKHMEAVLNSHPVIAWNKRFGALHLWSDVLKGAKIRMNETFLNYIQIYLSRYERIETQHQSGITAHQEKPENIAIIKDWMQGKKELSKTRKTCALMQEKIQDLTEKIEMLEQKKGG